MELAYPRHMPIYFSSGLELSFTRHWGALLLFHQDLTPGYGYHTRLEYFDPNQQQYPINYPDLQTEGRSTITPYPATGCWRSLTPSGAGKARSR